MRDSPYYLEAIHRLLGKAGWGKDMTSLYGGRLWGACAR